MEISVISISKVLCFVCGASHSQKELFIVIGQLAAGTGLDEILGDTSIDTAGLQTSMWM